MGVGMARKGADVFFFNRASRKIGELLYVSDIAHNIFLVVPVAEILFHLACKDLRETWQRARKSLVAGFADNTGKIEQQQPKINR